MTEPIAERDLRSLLAGVTILPLERALEILRAVGKVLQHAHDLGIVHHNINPSNIFLRQGRCGALSAVEEVELRNFGLAYQLTPRGLGEQPCSYDDLGFGPISHLAPEALELDGKGVDARSDQWSLAVLAYQMLSGRLPFSHDDPWCLRALIRGKSESVPLERLMPELPIHVLGAIHKALSKDKSQRFCSIADFIHAVDGMADRASAQTKRELCAELIEQCRRDDDVPPAVQTPQVTEDVTRQYPALSFPDELLASAGGQLEGESEPSLVPLVASSKPVQRQPGASWRLWLVSCIVVVLAPVLVLAALHYLRPAPHERPTTCLGAPQPAQPQLQVAAVAPVPALDTLAQRPTSRPMLAAVAHPKKAARPHREHLLALTEADYRCPTTPIERSKTPQQQAQAVLAEGLGF